MGITLRPVILAGCIGALAIAGCQSSGPVNPNTPAAVQTFDSGTVLYLQSRSNGHVARIGLGLNWGGSVVEVSMDGTNFVNAHDTGREVQPALYDANGGLGANGWDPVLGGDEYDHGSPSISHRRSADSLFTKATPLYWNPNAFGGGATAPVPSDMTFEQTVTVAPGAPLAFQLHLKLTHNGMDYHYGTQQEFPAVYVNSAYRTLVYYGGASPWTSAASTTAPVATTARSVYAPEQWAALVDANDQGLTVFVPGSYPSWAARYFPQSGGSGPTGDATVYMRPVTDFTIGPGEVIEGDVYLIPGDAAAARIVVYGLHGAVAPTIGLAAPFGVMDAPRASATLSGANYAVVGWAVGHVPVSAVNIYVDGRSIGSATLGSARPDVTAAFPGIAPVNCGWQYSLNTTTLANGVHTIVAHIVDASNNEVLLPPVAVTVSN
jgi:hypothetical protein